MLYNTDAIVVRNLTYGETHAIVNLLTPTGLVAAMARGAKKPQSRLAASIQLCAQGKYSIYQNTGMGTLQQAEVTNSRRGLREHLFLAAYASYFCELVLAVAADRPDGSEGLYRTFETVLDRLTNLPDEALTTRILWEVKVLMQVGASPQWTKCIHCGHEDNTLVAYSPSEGGLLCESCFATKSEHSIVTPAKLPNVLENLRKVPAQRIGSIRLSEEVTKAAALVLRMQLQEYGGIHLKSQKFLDDLESDNLLEEFLSTEKTPVSSDRVSKASKVSKRGVQEKCDDKN
ncbi:DNA repair protein RecO [Alicyclobacillus sp. SO9]|uniref:DNA repair protein RecO n=1 Tax=Alicyclobacillus sp. SO9 TaxID=2665646 RepID=UPI0018E85889|nr:DNA repair protein RecO [Alicyclobacillus sp. SO9]